MVIIGGINPHILLHNSNLLMLIRIIFDLQLCYLVHYLLYHVLQCLNGLFFFFFFSSRRRHTRYWRDWSSDVCSSDLDDMKVWEYLDFFARCYGIPAARRRQMIGDLLDLVDLGDKRNSYVQGLSRGMQQRLCLAHTLVHDPLVLLLDEPASGLDPRARVELRELLRELRALGKTILISSHILPELEELCTSVAIVDR